MGMAAYIFHLYGNKDNQVFYSIVLMYCSGPVHGSAHKCGTNNRVVDPIPTGDTYQNVWTFVTLDKCLCKCIYTAQKNKGNT